MSIVDFIETVELPSMMPILSKIWDLVTKNIDKFLILLVLLIFYRGAWYGYHWKIDGLANASIDLVKQLVAAFLTLTVGQRMAARNGDASNGSNGNGNGTPANGSSVGGVSKA